MRFSKLVKSNEKFCNGEQERLETKLRLNISKWAQNTLWRDLELFQPDLYDPETTKALPSPFLNQILSHFYGQAESSIALRLENQRNAYSLTLRNVIPAESQKKVIQALLIEARDKLIEKKEIRSQGKGYELYFRIGKDFLEYLLSDGQQEAEYYDDNVGSYIKTLLEEYCQLSHIERSKIYNKGHIQNIEDAVRNENLLKVVLVSKSKSPRSANNIMYVKPVGIREDTEHLYSYLVGLMSSTREAPWNIGSIRLSSILSCKEQKHKSCISKEEYKQMETAIKTKGVQYISDTQDTQRVVVEFTEYGEKMFRSILHLRPHCTGKMENRQYEFNCTLRQADNYFFRFGHNAKILEPCSLAEQFERKYRNAAQKYRKE